MSKLFFLIFRNSFNEVSLQYLRKIFLLKNLPDFENLGGFINLSYSNCLHISSILASHFKKSMGDLAQ